MADAHVPKACVDRLLVLDGRLGAYAYGLRLGV
jgi:hypothetical protein